MNFNNLQMHDEYSNTIIICGMKIFKGLFSYQIRFGFDAWKYFTGKKFMRMGVFLTFNIMLQAKDVPDLLGNRFCKK